MPTKDVFEAITISIGEATGEAFQLLNAVEAGGGCINTAYRLQGKGKAYFVKLNRRELVDMFEAEFIGLNEVAQTATVRVPRPVCCGVANGQSYLAMECLGLSSASSRSGRLLGHRLAEMHKIPQPFFGWHRDNTIGSTPQPNQRHDNWIEFWASQRLGFQLDLAGKRSCSRQLQNEGGKLLERLPKLFTDYVPKASLLHGDLWGGNYAADETGEPVIFDPACYYGDREADLAMTELFGGFGRDFYSAYNQAYPLDVGYSTRKTLYNLYHILNHFNLFGGGYLAQAESMLGRLLAETR